MGLSQPNEIFRPLGCSNPPSFRLTAFFPFSSSLPKREIKRPQLPAHITKHSSRRPSVPLLLKTRAHCRERRERGRERANSAEKDDAGDAFMNWWWSCCCCCSARRTGWMSCAARWGGEGVVRPKMSTKFSFLKGFLQLLVYFFPEVGRFRNPNPKTREFIIFSNFWVKESILGVFGRTWASEQVCLAPLFSPSPSFPPSPWMDRDPIVPPFNLLLQRFRRARADTHFIHHA